MSSLRLSFEVGFGQAIKKHRLANLYLIDKLLEKNAQFLILKSGNVESLHKAALELESFFVSESEDPKTFAYTLLQMKKSAQVILSKLSEGKIHKGSTKGLTSAIQKVHPQIRLILAKEMANKQEE